MPPVDSPRQTSPHHTTPRPRPEGSTPHGRSRPFRRTLPRRGRRRGRAGREPQGLRREIAKVIIGQDEVVEQLLTGLFARGHVLLVGVPGLAKTLLVSTVAKILSLSFRRIQFTPDMMPSDITGTDILQDDPETGRRKFAFIAGPLFANIILADEINRTPPKTQAACWRRCRSGTSPRAGQTYTLPDPFFVLATQNPIEQEGTYPLPEAQLDRFMLNIRVPYPTADEELEILRADDRRRRRPSPRSTLSAEQIVAIQRLVRRVPVPEHVFLYARDLVRASRPNQPEATPLVKKCVSWGAGPRAGQSLILAAKTRAVLDGRFAATVADVRHDRRAGPAAPDRHHLPRRGRGDRPRQGDRPPARRDRRPAREGRRAARRRATVARAGRRLRDRGLTRGRTPTARSPPPRRPRPVRPARTARPAGGRGGDVGPAQEPVQGLLRRVRRAPPVRPRRRDPPHRLAGLRQDRPLLRQGI